MNIPEIKNDVKPPARTTEHKAVPQEEKALAQRSDALEHQAVEKIEKTEDGRHPQSRFDKEKVRQVADKMESELAEQNLKLRFNVIEENKTIQVEVRDAENKVIKKIPADDMVKLAKSIRKHFQGSFVDKTF